MEDTEGVDVAPCRGNHQVDEKDLGPGLEAAVRRGTWVVVVGVFAAQAGEDMSNSSGRELIVRFEGWNMPRIASASFNIDVEIITVRCFLWQYQHW